MSSNEFSSLSQLMLKHSSSNYAETSMNNFNLSCNVIFKLKKPIEIQIDHHNKFLTIQQEKTIPNTSIFSHSLKKCD